MRAMAFTTTGGPEVLVETTLPTPQPREGEVLVRVSHAGVNYAEVQHRRGEFGRPDPGDIEVPGLEAAGRVAALGPGVAGLEVGDPVLAYLPRFGGYAEYAVTPAVFAHPAAGLDPAAAAGLPCVLPTAYGLVAEAARVREGDTVLVHAAAGGIGSVAGQLAKAFGASAVLGTVGDQGKAEHALRHGFDKVYLRDGFAEAVRADTTGRGVDVVLDPVGGPVRAASIELLAPFGRLAAFGDAGQHEDLRPALRDLWKLNRFVGGYNIGDLARRSPETIAAHTRAALRLLADGAIHLDTPATLPLTEAPTAHRLLENGQTQGKTVLRTASCGQSTTDISHIRTSA